MNEKINVLDHGFVRLVDKMGDDSAIVQAARVSYGSGTKKTRQDRALIRYLLRNKHTSPFEMCVMKFHIKTPIFVARQWLRHRTASVNEYSARYSEMQDCFYTPDKSFLAFKKAEKKASDLNQASLFDTSEKEGKIESIGKQSTVNKQGRDASIDENFGHFCISEIEKSNKYSYRKYESLLGDEGENGLSRELARLVLPVNIYTEFYWSINLHNLMHFLRLRDDEHAQKEIQEFASAVSDLMKIHFPITWEAYYDYIKNGASLSRIQIEMIRCIVHDLPCDPKELGATDREAKEVMNLLKLNF